MERAHDEGHRQAHDLPPVGRGVRVIYHGRERAAYLDGQGLWRDHHNGDVLVGEIGASPTSTRPSSSSVLPKSWDSLRRK